MELGEINVIFDKNNDGHYQQGERMEGTLELDLPNPLKVKSIYIKFEGKGIVKFYHQLPTNNRQGTTQSVLLHGEEEYMKHKYSCLKNHGDSVLLAKGKHVYPFAYHLPYDIPSTFEDDHGKIDYNLKIVVEFPRRLKQKSFRRIKIDSPLNLNLYPQLQEPTIVTLEKKNLFGSLIMFASAKLKVHVKIPRTGLEMGENIPIYVEVHNESYKNVSDVIIELKQITKFNGTTPKKETKTVTKSLAKSSLGLQPSRSLQNYNHDFFIPRFNYYNVKGSKIIIIEYELEITVVRGGQHSNINKKIPVSIGSWVESPPLYSV